MIELKGLRYETVSAYKDKNNEIEIRTGLYIRTYFELYDMGNKLRTTEEA